MTDRQPRGGMAETDNAPPRDGAERGRGPRPAIALGALDGHLGYLVRRLQLWIFQDFTRTLRKFDVRPAQYSVLVVIEANAGLSQADVAEALGIERARLVRLLDGLERRGLIRRTPSPRDRRSHALVLTRDGQRLLKPIRQLAATHESRLAGLLGADRHRALVAALRQLGELPAVERTEAHAGEEPDLAGL